MILSSDIGTRNVWKLKKKGKMNWDLFYTLKESSSVLGKDRSIDRWLRKTDDCPEDVRWISTKVRNNHMLPEEILTEDDVQKLVHAVTNIRDKALILVLYESGCRIGEILSLKLKNVQFDEYGAQLIVYGKTGMRRVRIIDRSCDTSIDFRNVLI